MLDKMNMIQITDYHQHHYSFSPTCTDRLYCAAHMVLHYVKPYHLLGSNYHAVITPKQTNQHAKCYSCCVRRRLTPEEIQHKPFTAFGHI